MTRQTNTESDTIERRSFLALLIGIIGTGITAVLGTTFGRFALAPALKKTAAANWLALGKLAELPADKLTRKAIIIAQDAGWGQFQAKRLLWVHRKTDELRIFSAVCPHLGCTVNRNEQEFVCACHNSKWNNDGQKIAGPAPRNLDVLEHRIENDVVQINYQDFKQGVAHQEPL